jgi:hypothetical protein
MRWLTGLNPRLCYPTCSEGLTKVSPKPGMCRWINPELIGGPYSYRAVGDGGHEAGR